MGIGMEELAGNSSSSGSADARWVADGNVA
jgi:hypothetical protein